MKKLSLLFTMLALLFVGGAQAANYKLGKSLTLEEALTKGNVALVFQKDASSALQVIYYDKEQTFTTTDTSNPTTHFALGSDASSVFAKANAQYRFKIAADMTYDNATAYSIKFVDDNSYFIVNYNGEQKADSKDNRPFVIKEKDGTTNGYEFTCYRTDDNNADRGITFANNGGTDAWYTNGIIYMYEIADVYDVLNRVPAKNSVPLTGMTQLFNWGESQTATVDADNAKLTTSTFTRNDSVKTPNVGAGFKGLSYKIADYDKLVIKATATIADVHVRVDDAGSYGNYQTEALSSDGSEQTITIDLTGSTLSTNNDNTKDGATQDARAMSTITQIYFWTMTAPGEAQFKEIYFERNGGIDKDYIVRQNTAADKYGTICLPFAASKPSNTTVYSVVGYDDSNVYLKEAESLEAGKAYVFKSSDANNITFTKNSTDGNLTAPTSATSGLIGTFTASTSVPKDSYILSGGKWLKVTADGNNTVNQYRAYLTLTDALVVASTPTGAKAMRINGGQTTAINGVNAATNAAAPAFNLAGQRVSNGYKGVVVKNGKKYIVK